MFRLLLLALVIASTAPALPARSKDLDWQDGVVTFRQTVRAGHAVGSAQRYRYLYRVRGSAGRYLVVLDRPLNASLQSPVSFSISGRHLFIRDEDGAEYKAAIVRQARPALRR